MKDPEHELEFHTPAGRPERLSAVWDRDREVRGRHPLVARRGRLGDGWRVWQVRLPGTARGDERAREALEHEVGAAVALHRAVGDGPHGQLFTRLVGYDLDASEPFVVYAPRRGRALADCGAQLNGKQLHVLMRGLVQAVRLLEHVGYVCRAISPDRIWWDGRSAWLSELFGAVPTGQPRTAFGEEPWAAPEQRAGVGESDARDDVWSVARVMYAVFAGHPGPATGPPADLDAYPGLTALSDAGAFSPRAADRPGPRRVLRLLDVDDPSRGVPLDDLEAGRLDFDEKLAAKRRSLGLAAPAGGQDDAARVGGGAPRAARPWWRSGGRGAR
ncbi:hypothetical protein [Streptomyces sp. 8K308]|uniref:hypothetical protein n=1 Tax=Streptomyces sp. 8K308 TaxID=2530388 RepID=UPI00140497A1|nr:hypothetical protein [Streptomyces sp. 8K308]